MEYFSRKMVVSWSNKIFRHSFLLRFDTRPTHFQRRIFCTRNSINACVCVRYIFNEARDTRPPMSMEWKKSGKGKNSQNTKEPSTMLFGLKNIDIRMAQLCNFFFFFLHCFTCRYFKSETIHGEIRRVKKIHLFYFYSKRLRVWNKININ